MIAADDKSIKNEIDRLEGLAAALRHVLEHGMPTADDLRDQGAPIIDKWEFGTRPKTVLEGEIYGHPDRSIYGLGVTSGLCLINTELGVARTLSRWYRLGKRLVHTPPISIEDLK